MMGANAIIYQMVREDLSKEVIIRRVLITYIDLKRKIIVRRILIYKPKYFWYEWSARHLFP